MRSGLAAFPCRAIDCHIALSFRLAIGAKTFSVVVEAKRRPIMVIGRPINLGKHFDANHRMPQPLAALIFLKYERMC